MKLLIAICLGCMMGFNPSKNPLDLEYVRSQFEKASGDKQVCKDLINQLSSHIDTDVHLAYLGACQAAWANHVLNPFTKLKSFDKGKNNIDQAVKRSSNCAEIRFVRLSVQTNCPRFLGYSEHIEEDRAFLIHNQNSITSGILSRMVAKILKDTDKLE